MNRLEVYLQQHWAAAAGGRDLARRVASAHAGTDIGGALQAIALEVVEDQDALRSVLVLLGYQPQRIAPLLVRAAERVGRLKPNGRVLRRSPVTDVLEVEALRGAVSAKRAGWDALVTLGDQLAPVAEEDVRRMQERADEQLAGLAEVHETLVRRCLG